MFSSLLKVQNLCSSSGLVKISASYLSQNDISFGLMVSQETVSYINVFGS
jgi:hypothetical protein